MDHELLHIFEELKSKNWNKDLINYKRSLIKNPVIQTRVSSLVDFIAILVSLPYEYPARP